MDLGMKLFERKSETEMLWGVKLWILIACAGLAAGCKNEVSKGTASVPAAETPAPSAGTAEIPRTPEGRPQPRLQTVKLWLGTNEITAEVAHTMPQIMTGMMWRTNMAEMDGMLFVFGQPHRAQFWMRNTLLPLSCAYVDPEGAILELHDMKPRDESPIPAGSDQVQYVLEMNLGWFQRHNVTPGMLISTERGSLSKLFFGR